MALYTVADIVSVARAIEKRGDPVTRQSLAVELGVGTEAVDQAVTNARQAGALDVLVSRSTKTRYRVSRRVRGTR